MKTIYVAGASKEVEQVSKFIEALKVAGWTITYDWTIDVRAMLAAGKTDRDMPTEVKESSAVNDLQGVVKADWFWLIIPKETSKGCWFEYGAAATQLNPFKIVASGSDPLIFLELIADGCKFDTHEKAFQFLCKVNE